MEMKNGYFVVRTKEDLEKAIELKSVYVSAICCKCGDNWTSLIHNAKMVIEKGCTACEDWQPTPLVINETKPKMPFNLKFNIKKPE